MAKEEPPKKDAWQRAEEAFQRRWAIACQAKPEAELYKKIAPPSRGDVYVRDWSFCRVTGTWAVPDAENGVFKCVYEHVPWTAPLEPHDDKIWVVSEVHMPRFIDEYKLDMLIKSREELQLDAIMRHRVRQTVEEACPECKAPRMEYHVRQLRSADEGQTVFFECRECGYRNATNN